MVWLTISRSLLARSDFPTESMWIASRSPLFPWPLAPDEDDEAGGEVDVGVNVVAETGEFYACEVDFGTSGKVWKR